VVGVTERFVLLYVTLSSAFNVSLLLLSESRIDTYVALNILSFYVSYSLARPSTRSATMVRLIHALLLSIFAFLVGSRVYEVLMR
jgi:hypothetical protein